VRAGRSDLGVRVDLVVGTWGRVQTPGSRSYECGKEDGTIVACYSTFGPLPNRRISQSLCTSQSRSI